VELYATGRLRARPDVPLDLDHRLSWQCERTLGDDLRSSCAVADQRETDPREVALALQPSLKQNPSTDVRREIRSDDPFHPVTPPP
jgi:hypothetical protein